MKKTFLGFAVTAILIFSSVLLQAQFSLGGQFGYPRYAMFGFGQPSLGLKAEYALTKKNAVSLSFNYYLPKKIEFPTYVTEIDRGFNPMPTLQVAGEFSWSGININLEAKRYTFKKEFQDKFAYYFICGAGYTSFKYSDKIKGYYDKELYQADADDLIGKMSFNGLTINLGFGTDVMIGGNILSIEAKSLLPATQANGQAIEVEIPFTYTIQLGYRIVL